MNFDLSVEDLAFQTEIRRFFREEYPAHILDKVRAGRHLTRQDHAESQLALQSRGWLGIGWPVECGGPDWTPFQRYVFAEAREAAGAPAPVPMSIVYIGPIIAAFGSPEQKQRWLPDILNVRSFWCQGYSEPEAGSDLASLTFSAVREGDEYVLNGTKIWTTQAHWADWIFVLARTSTEPRRQDGISLICTEMTNPGITVHPILSIDGTHDFNRVEFSDVRVPLGNRIGEEGAAWRYANILLKNERLSYAFVGSKKADLARARSFARSTPATSWGDARTAASPPKMMIDDPAFRRRLATVQIELDALEVLVLRALLGDVEMSMVSMVKILSTECSQHVTELFLEIAGRNRVAMLDRHEADWSDAAPLVPPSATIGSQTYLTERNATLYGGTTEIQKEIIWRSMRKANVGSMS